MDRGTKAWPRGLLRGMSLTTRWTWSVRWDGLQNKSTLAGWQVHPQTGELAPEVNQKPYYVRPYKPPKFAKPSQGA